MKVAIVGSRDYADLAAVAAFVNTLPSDAVVISGGARGVDRAAEVAARQRGLQVEVFLPDWNKHGKAAGFIRNQLIVDAADRVVAFWDGISRGTQHTMTQARLQRKTVSVFLPGEFEVAP